jgi:4-hydroxyacetophenone monooxygenase
MTQPAINDELKVLAADPERLRSALNEADAATLLLVLVQFTGEADWLSKARPHIAGPMSYQEKMPADLRHAIRARLFDVLMERAASAAPLPALPDGELLKDMLSIAAGEPLGDEYLRMMSEELAPPPEEAPLFDAAASALGAPADFRVLIIGAGMSGLCAAVRLAQAGVNFSIVEKNATVGGTWLENSYPGCGVDTPNHFYSYSFAPYHDWSMLFAKRRELWDYFERVADEYSIRERITFDTEVESAIFDENTKLWAVMTRGAGGRRRFDANVVISCVGVLNRPKIPEIPGLQDFTGSAFHTAQWDAGFDWRGKRVAMVGTGASGHQVGPTIAPDVERLTIFQRSPHWIVPNPNYFERVPEGVKWLLAHLPYYVRWYRFQLFWGFSDGLYSALQVDPTWDKKARSINAANERHRRFMERHMRAELGDDSPLLEKVMPDFPPYGKRILIDNHWYKMLKRPNVDLVTEPIERVTAAGIETCDGKVWPADALVFATGFQASKMLAPMEIRGRGGREIHQTWGEDDAQAYMGMTVPGYPNFFILLGPNTGLAHGGNAIFMTECQVRHVMACLRELVAQRRQTIEVREDVSERYNRTVDELHAGLVWTHPGVRSWYKNKRGRVFAISPWRLVEYWRMTGTLNIDDYIFA